MGRYKYLLILLGFSAFLFAFCFFHLRYERERRLMKEGADALFYDVRSEYDYTISFGMSIDQNRFYYSDTKN